MGKINFQGGKMDNKWGPLLTFLLGAFVATNWSRIKGWIPFLGKAD